MAGLQNGVVNYGKVKVGKFLKRRFTLANLNRKNIAIQFLQSGPAFVVNPAGNFGFLQGVQATDCPPTLAAKKTCWLDVYFVPQNNTNNPKQATLSIFDNADNAPQTFMLDGSGR